VFPGSRIVQNQVDSYPIKVIVTAELPGSKPMTIWSGRQQDLFGKYASKRAKSMEAIQANLRDFKEEFVDE